MLGRHDGRGLGCRMVCLSTPHRMGPDRENGKFTFFSLQLAVARGCKIDAKKVSEFYAKLPWESSLHHPPVQRYHVKQLWVPEGVRDPQLYYLLIDDLDCGSQPPSGTHNCYRGTFSGPRLGATGPTGIPQDRGEFEYSKEHRGVLVVQIIVGPRGVLGPTNISRLLRWSASF